MKPSIEIRSSLYFDLSRVSLIPMVPRIQDHGTCTHEVIQKRNKADLSAITYLGQGVLHHIAGISHDSQWKLAPTTITQRPRFIRFLLRAGIFHCLCPVRSFSFFYFERIYVCIYIYIYIVPSVLCYSPVSPDERKGKVVIFN